MSEYYTYECKYKHKFPVDEFDRPGGMFSMADLPINGHKVLEREGIVTAQDSKQKLYQVEDKERKTIKMKMRRKKNQDKEKRRGKESR